MPKKTDESSMINDSRKVSKSVHLHLKTKSSCAIGGSLRRCKNL